MNFATGIVNAYKTKWSYINTFEVKLNFQSGARTFSGWNSSDDENLNLHIISIDTPQFSNQSIEVFQANRWFIHNGRDELYRFTITFRDSGQMNLYRKFTKLYRYTREAYLDDCKITVELFKDADYITEFQKKILTFEDTMIESVSQLQFSNTTETQIAEFSVSFKTPSVELL